jgi:hypothetical protein
MFARAIAFVVTYAGYAFQWALLASSLFLFWYSFANQRHVLGFVFVLVFGIAFSRCRFRITPCLLFRTAQHAHITATLEADRARFQGEVDAFFEKWLRDICHDRRIVKPEGNPEPGDQAHLLLGARAYVIEVFLKSINSEFRGDRKLPMLFPTFFPDVLGTDKHLVGHEVCDVVRRFLEDRGWSHLSIFEILKFYDCPGVGHADVFLSHSQAETVNSTISFMSNHDRRKCQDNIYFLDYLTIRQCLPGDFKPSIVANVIENIKCTLLVLSPLSNPLARGWCVYEVACALNIPGVTLFCNVEAMERQSNVVKCYVRKL